MPIDFAELMNRTPEQRAALLQQSQKRFEEEQRRLLAARMDDLRAAQLLQPADPQAQDFIEQMGRRAKQRDHCGLEGGLMLTLTEGQVRFLTRLAERGRKQEQSSPGRPASVTVAHAPAPAAKPAWSMPAWVRSTPAFDEQGDTPTAAPRG